MLLYSLLLTSLFFHFQNGTLVENKDWKKYFDKEEVKGTFLLYDLKKEEWAVYNPKLSRFLIRWWVWKPAW